MLHRFTHRSLKLLFLIALSIGCTCFAAHSPRTSVRVTGNAPLRLRLRVENNTVRSGQATRISAEFLDQYYQQVANDGTRVIEFTIAPANANSGVISPQLVKVGPGAWSADATFASRQPGRIVIGARAAGLDSAQTILLVTRPGASVLSQLFETVAYAQDNSGFDIWWQTELEAQANNNSKTTFQVTFSEPPSPGTRVRVRVDPPATIIYDGKARGTQTEVTLGEGKGISDNVDVISGKPATVSVKAKVLPAGPEKSASLRFIAPRPSRLIFDDDVKEIISTEHTVPICVQLTDDSGNPLEADAERYITLKPANDEDPVEFEPSSLVFSPNRHQLFAQSLLRLKGLPGSNELTVLAVPRDSNLKAARKTIIIRSRIERIMLTGPSEVTRGNSSAQFTVKLTDKDGKSIPADWDRRISLSATYGTFSPTAVTIPKGQDTTTVRYVSAGTTGKVSLKAESGGLTDGSQEIVLITAVYWLVLAAVLGGLVGGAVRHLPRGDDSGGDQPKESTVNWRGLVGSIAGSIASGLFLFLTMKLGLSRMLGSLALPSVDYGTILVAFFFGGIGGFAGPVVFERLVNAIMPPVQKHETPQPAASGAN